MLTLFNAGYKRGEIEEAAKALQTSPSYPIPIQKPQTQPLLSLNPLSNPKKLPQTPVVKSLSLKKPKPFTPIQPKQIQPIPQKPLQPVPQTQPPQTPQPIPQKPFQSLKRPLPVQKTTPLVSSYYEKSKKSPRSIMIVALSILLSTLILFLVGVFLFRNVLIGFFNSFF